MKRLLFIPIAFAITIAASGQALRTFNSTNDLVDASHNPMSQNTNSWVISTNDMSYQLWTWWQGDTSAVGTYNLQSLRPGVTGRYKLVENLHWNHVPDVNGDTFVIINNTNQGGLIGALTVPYIPYASGTNKLRDSHLYWLATGTGTDTNLYFGPGQTNVLYRSGSDLVVTNGNTANSKLTLYNGNAIGLSMVAQGPTSAAIQTEGAGANTLILRQNTDQVSLTTGRFAPTIDSTESLGSLNDKWLNLHLSGTNTLWTLYDPLAPTVNYDYTVLEKSATNGPFVIDQRTGGTAGYSRGFSFRTNGVEVFNVTGTGGPSSGANWTAVGTTDSSLAGTANANGGVFTSLYSTNHTYKIESLSSAATISLDLSTNLPNYKEVYTLTHDTTFSVTGASAGRWCCVSIYAASDNTNHTVAFPAWHFLNTVSPISLVSNKVAVVQVFYRDALDANAIASWSVEP